MNWAEQIMRKGNFTLSSGVKTDTLFDCSMLSLGETADLALQLSLHHFKFNQPVSFLGVAYGGITLAHEFAGLLCSPLAIYTKEGEIRGNLPTRGVVIVDDVVTTGHSVLAAANAIDLLGLPAKDEHDVVAVISLIRRLDINSRPLPWPHYYLYSNVSN